MTETPMLTLTPTKKSEPWVSQKAYDKDDVVTLEGKTFVSLVDDNHNTPSTSATDWKVQ